jgi:sulfoxide reductase heme-binding subunit YedZ
MTTALPVWYLMRASGIVALILLSVAFALGIATSNRWRPSGSRLHVTTMIHRNASLLAVCFLAVHVVTSLVDLDVAIRLADVVLPSGSLSLTAGALSLDLVAALVATSLLGRRVPYRTWRAIHWSAYLAWPLAVVHGLAMGTDASTWWSGAITVACVSTVAGTVAWRLVGPAPTASYGK